MAHESHYNLELSKVIDKIKEMDAKTVCIQIPDGLKPKAKIVKELIEKQTEATVFIWAGTCFGGCDMPPGLDKIGIDLMIQWGHSEWR